VEQHAVRLSISHVSHRHHSIRGINRRTHRQRDTLHQRLEPPIAHGVHDLLDQRPVGGAQQRGAVEADGEVLAPIDGQHREAPPHFRCRQVGLDGGEMPHPARAKLAGVC